MTPACPINLYHLMPIDVTSQIKLFKLGRITSSQHSVALLTHSLSTYGVNSVHRWNSNSTYSTNPTPIQDYLCILTSMATMTTTVTHLFPSEWKQWSMTILTAENHLRNTAPKGMS